MTARSDELQKGALFPGLAPFFVSEFCHALGILGKRQSISCVLPHALQVERSSLFSRVYFATDICDKQALDFMYLENCRKTYQLCDTPGSLMLTGMYGRKKADPVSHVGPCQSKAELLVHANNDVRCLDDGIAWFTYF
jgi:hypothetical protein